MKCGVVVVAAGEGRRLGGGGDKLFILLGGRPLLAHAILNFQHCPGVDEIVLVASSRVEERYRREIEEGLDLSKVTAIVRGGARRQDSVYRGLTAFSSPPEIVLIHDGDRPFISPDLIGEVIEQTSPGGGDGGGPGQGYD